jgi:hypothetical protein
MVQRQYEAKDDRRDMLHNYETLHEKSIKLLVDSLWVLIDRVTARAGLAVLVFLLSSTSVVAWPVCTYAPCPAVAYFSSHWLLFLA